MAGVSFLIMNYELNGLLLFYFVNQCLMIYVCMHIYRWYILSSHFRPKKNSNIYLQLLNKISNIVNEIVKEKKLSRKMELYY